MKPIVNILGRRYKLGTKPGEDPADDVRYIGTIVYSDRSIDIVPDIHIEAAVDSLFHEVNHAILHHQDIAPDEHEVLEHTVRLLETGFVAFLRDNGVNLAPLRKLIRQSRE